MKPHVNLTEILERAKTVYFDDAYFHIEWRKDFSTETTAINKDELENLLPGLLNAATMLNRAYSRHVLTNWKNLVLNREFLANPVVVETKVGSQIYVSNLEDVKAVGNVIQLNGDFHLLKKHRPRDKVLPSSFYLIDDCKKLSSSLSITRTFLDKQFPGFESRLTAALSLDMPITEIKEQLFMRNILSSLQPGILPNEFSVA